MPCTPFEVTLTKEGEILSYDIDNEEMVAAITIIKKDAETKETIEVAGTEFRILNSEKEVVLDHIVTDESGKAVLPKRLPCGTYYLEEVKAPAGYLKGNLLEFTITEKAEWDSPILLECFDERGKRLPETGSRGMVYLMLFGTLLAFAAMTEKKNIRDDRR